MLEEFHEFKSHIGQMWESIPQPVRARYVRRSGVTLALVTVLLGVFLWFIRPPRSFIPETVVDIPKGTSVSEAGALLKDAKVIRSAKFFKALMIMFHKSELIAGDYMFVQPPSLFEVTRSTARGRFGQETMRVYLPEGSTVVQMAEILEKAIPRFNGDAFIRLAKDKEGYLYPDTYFFFPSATPEEVIETLESTFWRQVGNLLASAESQGKSFSEIVIMASIIEKEANHNLEEQKIVAGILWNRLRRDMPLQVDAPFVYIIGKGSSKLTRQDLAMDSPYNTYRNPGLPPTPIGNPSRMSIEAAVFPKDSNYLFYLHGRDGTIHYGRTHTEHLANKNRYLR